MTDAWVDIVEAPLRDKEFWTTKEILVEILGYEPSDITTLAKTRVDTSMEYLEYKRKRVKQGQRWQTGWSRE